MTRFYRSSTTRISSPQKSPSRKQPSFRKFQHTVPPSNIPQTTQTLLHLIYGFRESTFIFSGYIFVRYCFFSHGFFPRKLPKIPSSQAAAAAAAAASAAWFHILNYSARRRPRRAQPTQLLVEPKKTTVAEVQVEWRCGEV